MVRLREKRVLFFIRGPVPTEEQEAEAIEYGRNVGFRNVNFTRPDETLEDFDIVVGDVPPIYRAEADRRAGRELPVKDAPRADAGALPPAGSPIAPAAPAGGSPAGWRPNT
jgi:hypothetical protein